MLAMIFTVWLAQEVPGVPGWLQDTGTWETAATVAGGAVLVVVITTALRLALGWRAAWIALLVSALVSVAAELFTAGMTAPGLTMAVVRACFVFLAALLMNEALVSVLPLEKQTQQQAKPGKRGVTEAVRDRNRPRTWLA